MPSKLLLVLVTHCAISTRAFLLSSCILEQNYQLPSYYFLLPLSCFWEYIEVIFIVLILMFTHTHTHMASCSPGWSQILHIAKKDLDLDYPVFTSKVMGCCLRVSILAQTSWLRSKLGRKGFIWLTLCISQGFTAVNRHHDQGKSYKNNI